MIIYSEPKAASHIPVIDLQETFGSDAAALARTAAEIGAACRDTGFFYVKNHGIDRAAIAQAFAEADRFFDHPVPWKEKLRAEREHHRHGYEPPETQRLDNNSPADLKESFVFAKPGAIGTPDFGTNTWPDDLPGFRENLEAYYEAALGLGAHLTRLIARSLGLSPTFFDTGFQTTKAPLRLLRYPPQPGSAKPNQLGAGAHTDWGWITVLAQDEKGGLEVESMSGYWVRAEPIPDTLVINLGDMMPRYTNGLYHSNMHRVMNNRANRNRHSIVLFYEPAYNTRVECLPSCLEAEQAPKFPPCTAGEHKAERAAASRPKVRPKLDSA